jgi:cob(I)alamin adenosyltransferase
MKRLTGKYLEGTGDTGFSNLSGIEGRVSKGSFYTTFFSSLDELQHSLANFLALNPEMIEEVDQQFLRYLLQLSFSINAFIYSAGEDDPKVKDCPNWCEKQLPGQDAYDFMKERIDYFKEQCALIEGVKTSDLQSEFIVPSSYLNKLRLKTRYLESSLWAFRDQRRDFFADKLKQEMLEVDKHGKNMESVKELVDTWEVVRKRIAILGTFLNRLSSYWFWAMKLYLLQNHGQTEEWRSEAPKLSDFIKEN